MGWFWGSRTPQRVWSRQAVEAQQGAQAAPGEQRQEHTAFRALFTMHEKALSAVE